MCGISGVLKFNRGSVCPAKFEQFNNTLSHRGPDFGDVFIEKNNALALGHRRLSIIDLDSRSNQPMHSRDGRFVLTFNGEIYNFREIRLQLEQQGYQFITDSDTEVLLTAYEHWGEGCLNQFNGMWAFGIWDRKEQSLFLSRDRFGVKPLYFVEQSGGFAFASEQKSFSALEGMQLELDANVSAYSICNNGLIEAIRPTIYKNVQRLHGGESLKVYSDGSTETKRWWKTYEHMDSQETTDPDGLRDAFIEATKLRTRADVPLATSLSGGLDSSSVTSCLASYAPETKVKAFIGAFPGSNMDESMFATSLTQSLNMEHLQIDVTETLAAQVIEDTVKASEEILPQPPIGPFCIYLAQKAQGNKLSLEGHGGDELLGGYSSHAQAVIGELLQEKGNPVDLANGIIACSDLLSGFDGYNSSRLKSAILNSTTLDLGLKNDHKLLRFWGDYSLSSFSATYDDQQKLEKKSWLTKKLYWDFHSGCLQSNLRDFDRLSMAHGIEVRSPFMDWQFVVKCFNSSDKVKLWNGKSKRLIRDYFHFVPKEIRHRKTKLGFNNPFQAWLGNSLKIWILDLVNSKEFLENRFFDGPTVSKVVSEAYRKNTMADVAAMWPLLNLILLDRK